MRVSEKAWGPGGSDNVRPDVWSNKEDADAKFNDYIAGEFEHRNPVLWIVLPAGFDLSKLKRNSRRLVTHRDLHATWMGLLDSRSATDGIDLIRGEVPQKRSCRQVGVSEWCNCFERAVAASATDANSSEQCVVDSWLGEKCHRPCVDDLAGNLAATGNDCATAVKTAGCSYKLQKSNALPKIDSSGELVSAICPLSCGTCNKGE